MIISSLIRHLTGKILVIQNKSENPADFQTVGRAPNKNLYESIYRKQALISAFIKIFSCSDKTKNASRVFTQLASINLQKKIYNKPYAGYKHFSGDSFGK
jgi:hypothetical protein